jgi:hypothetical protein
MAEVCEACKGKGGHSDHDTDQWYWCQDCDALEQHQTRLCNAAKDSKLAAAWHLAKGSFLTAKDLGIRLESSDEVMSDEMKGLAANFLRISELLVEAGFKP